MGAQGRQVKVFCGRGDMFSSLRGAQRRSNPECDFANPLLDCFAALAMTTEILPWRSK
jgi:hypothetical protein